MESLPQFLYYISLLKILRDLLIAVSIAPAFLKTLDVSHRSQGLRERTSSTLITETITRWLRNLTNSARLSRLSFQS